MKKYYYKIERNDLLDLLEAYHSFHAINENCNINPIDQNKAERQYGHDYRYYNDEDIVKFMEREFDEEIPDDRYPSIITIAEYELEKFYEQI